MSALAAGAAVRWEVSDSIAQFDRGGWNALAVDLYSSHEWLTTVEGETGARCRYVGGYVDGRLVAALPVYLVSTETNRFYLPSGHFDVLPPNRGGPTCLLGGNRGYRNQFLLAPDLDQTTRRDVLAGLGATLTELLRATRVERAYFLYLTGRATDVLAELGGASTPVATYAGEALLPVVGASFEDYLATLSSTRRKTTQKEMRRFRRSGATVQQESAWQHRDLVVRLVANLNKKHRRGFSSRELAIVLDLQLDQLGDAAVLFTCRRNGDPVGVVMGFVWNNWLYTWYAGFDYDRACAYEYFNTAIYEPLRYCYRAGLSGMHLGVGTQHAKGVRGARIEPLYAAVWSPTTDQDSVTPKRRAVMRSYWHGQRAAAPQAFEETTWRPVLDSSGNGSPMRITGMS